MAGYIELSPELIKQMNDRFEKAHPKEILSWAADIFGDRVAAASSFQTQSIPLLHIISQTTPSLDVLFLDTGFHFPETLVYRDKLIKEMRLNVRVIKPTIEREQFLSNYGELYRSDPDLCCYYNKVLPMQKALAEYDAWVSGIRRDQTKERQNTPIIMLDTDGKYKINPLVNWTSQDIKLYRRNYNLPEHPLLEQGYTSIGCAPCTRPVRIGEDERSGRWAGQAKTECGLHIPKDELSKTATGKFML